MNNEYPPPRDKKIIDELLLLFPEFLESKEWNITAEQELSYSTYGAFVDYLRRRMKDVVKPENDPLVIKAYKHFDELVSSDDDYISNLGVTQVVEQLSQEWDTLRLMKKLFSKQSLEWVDKSLKYTGLVRNVSEIPD